MNNTAADLTVHAWTASIHPPISAVHPTFDKPFTCGNAAMWTGTGARCGIGRSVAVQAVVRPNVPVVPITGTGFRHNTFRDPARCGRAGNVKRLDDCERESPTPERLLIGAETADGASCAGDSGAHPVVTCDYARCLPLPKPLQFLVIDCAATRPRAAWASQRA